MRSTHPPSTGHSPCSLCPSSTKNAVAAARSSTTMPTCSIRWIVMRSTVAERRPQLQRLSVAGLRGNSTAQSHRTKSGSDPLVVLQQELVEVTPGGALGRAAGEDAEVAAGGGFEA